MHTALALYRYRCDLREGGLRYWERRRRTRRRVASRLWGSDYVCIPLGDMFGSDLLERCGFSE
jgi:hypothetical protein